MRTLYSLAARHLQYEKPGCDPNPAFYMIGNRAAQSTGWLKTLYTVPVVVRVTRCRDQKLHVDKLKQKQGSSKKCKETRDKNLTYNKIGEV